MFCFNCSSKLQLIEAHTQTHIHTDIYIFLYNTHNSASLERCHHASCARLHHHHQHLSTATSSLPSSSSSTALCAHSECSYTQAAPGLKKCSLRIHLCAWALKCPLHVSETTRKYDAFAEVCKNCTWNKYEPSWGRGSRGSSNDSSWAHTTMGDTGNNTTQWQGPQNVVCALSL